MMNNLEKLVAAFDNCTLPRKQWTHTAHLKVAWWYLKNYEPQIATELIRKGIQKYNASVGIQNTPNSGYHETITLFWIQVLQNYLSEVDVENFIQKLDKNLLLQYYTRDLLMSIEARVNWVEPDLQRIQRM
jgi:hypothetical protein